MASWKEDCARKLGVDVNELVFGTDAPGGERGANIGVSMSKLTSILGNVDVSVFTVSELQGLHAPRYDGTGTGPGDFIKQLQML